MSDECAERLDELEEMVQSLRDDYEATRDHVIQPQIDGLEDLSDDARADRAELRSDIDALQAQVDRLQATLDALSGLADGQESNPHKRAQDLAQALIRRAEARSENDKASMWWKEVRDMLADQGHGEVSKPDCYKAMDWVADGDSPAFSEGTKTSDSGNQVKAVRVELDALRADDGSRNPTTRERVSGGESAGPGHGGDTITTDVATD